MKLIIASLCICVLSVTTLASAETLYVPGISGIRDQFSNEYCSQPVVSEAKTSVDQACLLGYPINLPVGKTIDSIEVAYIFDTWGAPGASIAAYLLQNRIKPDLGVTLLAGTNTLQINPVAGGSGFLNMAHANAPILNGSTYWVVVPSTAVDVRYVAVTYH